VDCPLHGGEVDYSEVHCPEAERVAYEKGCRLDHRIFLGGRQDMNLILQAIRKLRENTGELHEAEEAEGS
jgi:hypothetical protein